MERSINGPEQELLSPAEAAKWCGIPLTTWNGWAKSGAIPASRGPNKSVQWYSWEEVYAIRILLVTGFLPLVKDAPAPPGRSQ